ncbi:hypothetical protein V5799_006041 [Amblyomma americanum]|uniref:Ubiquitin-conjugating enzyme E2 Z n=1 Tax=Amblyomma americanum TaxID=6943 RepID=A0AAQ4DXI6_AMBAM
MDGYRPRGMFVEQEETDATKIHAVILGPPGTPYEGGFFHFLIKCPTFYPLSPPRVRFMTTDAGRVRFGPNFYENGKVCLGLLGTWTGPSWTTRHSIASLLLSIRSLLNENPISSGQAFGVLPAVGTWCNDSICYNAVLRHETIRVAVCDAVEACLLDTSPLPPALRDIVLKHFSQLYAKYEESVKQQLHLTGACMNDAFEGGVAVYQYATLRERLRDLRDMVMTRNEAAAD